MVRALLIRRALEEALGMPELPDVEGQRAALAEQLTGTRVLDVRVLDAGVLRNATAGSFRDRLLGRRFHPPGRHGKWLVLPTDGPTLLVHNGMTGRPSFVAEGTEPDAAAERNDRLVITTDAGELHYADLRKLRGWWIVDTDAEIAAVIGDQGPDALDLSRPGFRAALHGRRGAVKSVLMNQRVLAGLGNMLTDEICWRARVHPAAPMSSLDDEQLGRVHQAMRRTLRSATRQGRIPRTRGWLNSTRDRDPAPCPRCRTTLRRSTIGGRTSIWCPHCQPSPRP